MYLTISLNFIRICNSRSANGLVTTCTSLESRSARPFVATLNELVTIQLRLIGLLNMSCFRLTRGFSFFGDGALELSTLTSICIPTSVYLISKDSFAFCHRAVKVEFEVGCRISVFGDGTFSDSASLQTISIPASLGFIDKHCFVACNQLLTVSFETRSRLSLVDESAFPCCAALTQICLL
jgi:hypothetical protein